MCHCFQSALAAFLAISVRRRFDSLAARALPPLDAPSLLSATAAGLRVSGGSGRACPVASWTIWKARALTSRGRFLLAREGTPHCRTSGRPVQGPRFSKLDHYRRPPRLELPFCHGRLYSASRGVVNGPVPARALGPRTGLTLITCVPAAGALIVPIVRREGVT